MKMISFVERDSHIVEIVYGKSVLHLGCVGFTDGTPGGEDYDGAKEPTCRPH